MLHNRLIGCLFSVIAVWSTNASGCDDGVLIIDDYLFFEPHKLDPTDTGIIVEIVCVPSSRVYAIQFRHDPAVEFDFEITKEFRKWHFEYNANGEKVELEDVLLAGSIQIKLSNSAKILLNEKFEYSVSAGQFWHTDFGFRTPFRFFGNSQLEIQIQLDIKASNEYLERYDLFKFGLVDPKRLLGH